MGTYPVKDYAGRSFELRQVLVLDGIQGNIGASSIIYQ